MRPLLCLTTALTLTLAALPARAEPPGVLVDTMPLHALVARVMEGVGTPDLLLPPGATPHDFQLRPSDAERLAQAQVVIWTGEGLVPWLAEPLATLAPQALTVEMLATGGWAALPARTDAAFAHDGHDHGHDHGDDDAAAAEDHDDHDAHGEAEDHADHDAHGEAEGHGDHAGIDPHAWLDPAVAAAWTAHIAEALSQADPENAAAYAANAAAAGSEMAALKEEMAATLAPATGRAFIVPHDAYQYLEVAFGLQAAGAIALTDASSPGPARIAELRDLVAAGDVACILTDPQTSAEWSALLADGSLARTAQVDPDGTSLTPGAALYPTMMRAMAQALADCLAPG
jgi:zinc transport system substrate-binding protein